MRYLVLAVILVFLLGLHPAPAQTAAAERTLLNQYCVTCHNDKLKTANFSLQNLDIPLSAIIPKSGSK